MSCGISCRHALDLELLWLQHRLAVADSIQTLAWELAYAAGMVLKKKEKKKRAYMSIDKSSGVSFDYDS